MSSTEASLMMITSSVAGQSKLSDIRSECWLKRPNRSSQSAVLCDEVMDSMAWFTVISCDWEIEWVAQLHLQSIFSTYFTEKAFYCING